MDNACVHCGSSIYFYEEGIFYIQGLSESDVDRLSYPFKYSNRMYSLSYDSLKIVEELTTKLMSINRQNEIKCGISQTEKYINIVDLGQFSNRIHHRKAVEYIQNGELTSHLQPIVELQSGGIYGYESLLRSNKSQEHFSPGELFSVASSTGLHSMLDQRAREEAIKAKKKYIRPGLKSFINFLPSTIYNPEFCLKHTFQVVDKYQVDPGDLVFEVVETEKIVDIDHLKAVFKTYKREGIKVALDDVGAGFSTIEILKLLEPDYVKIDRSYISFCDTDSQKQIFLKEVHHLSKELGIKILAEGIERQQELEICREIGFDLGQGYLFGKPSEAAIEPDCSSLLIS
ncbi:EAL domain-containing protein [Jeotgalibacillus soli]|uniref:EAL domain-containing protein n=1 Tax=Jeotgalibacillus soli TaxID=889306 RepID=A0A0C2VPB6_9BACL|nr:EAL domain-containing protein [Jeotgalibacillus soli]KIL45853.1 hypothetical protein KP78_22020 [Jeotgalibacillus soli]